MQITILKSHWLHDVDTLFFKRGKVRDSGNESYAKYALPVVSLRAAYNKTFVMIDGQNLRFTLEE